MKRVCLNDLLDAIMRENMNMFVFNFRQAIVFFSNKISPRGQRFLIRREK